MKGEIAAFGPQVGCVNTQIAVGNTCKHKKSEGKSQDLVKGQNCRALTGPGKKELKLLKYKLRLRTSLIHLHLEAYRRHGSQAGKEKMKNVLLMPWEQSRAHGHASALLLVHSSPWDSHLLYCQCFSKACCLLIFVFS